MAITGAERRNDGTTERTSPKRPVGQSARRLASRAVVAGLAFMSVPIVLSAQDTPVQDRGDSVQVHFIDADLRAVVQALGSYLPKPLIVAGLPGVRVTLDTPTPVARGAVAGLLRGLIESQNLLFVEDSGFIRIGPMEGVKAEGREGGKVDGEVRLFVMRLKHARAADVAATVNLLFGGSGEFSGRSGLGGGPDQQRVGKLIGNDGHATGEAG